MYAMKTLFHILSSEQYFGGIVTYWVLVYNLSLWIKVHDYMCLQVNGISLADVSHEKAACILKDLPTGQVKVEISQDIDKWKMYNSSQQTTKIEPQKKRRDWIFEKAELQVLDLVDGKWYLAVVHQVTATHVSMKYPKLSGVWEETRTIGNERNY
jgi:hypothetical protein